jgi:HAD superfamily hydrolase (TIGR01509 family)
MLQKQATDARHDATASLEDQGRRIRAVLFDCDGVMFDTTEANTAYYNHLLRHFGRPDMTGEQVAFAQVNTVFETIAHLFGDDARLEAEVMRYRQQISYARFISHMVMEPWLERLLMRLRPDYLTAIATNRTDTMGRILSDFGIDDQFDLVVTALDVERAKPHPDSLNKVLTHFGLSPDQAIYIGDSSLDELAAAAAGVHFIAYGNRALRAGFHIDSLKDVLNILGRLNQRSP